MYGVIVPAYNEGNLVFQHYYIANSNFPKHKLQILAIDDGSKR
jgi:hyaluronan synthase